MVENDATRFALKTQLLQRVENLGLQQSLFPTSDESIDKIVQKLEDLNPIPYPLQSSYLSLLLGNWELVYASRGTVVTRQIALIPDFWGGIKIKRVWQTLVAESDRKISASNSAKLELFLLGEWQLQAEGLWKWDRDEQTANVSFNSFSLQAIKPFGFSNLSFTELKIPVVEFLQKEALWITSYLDQEIRIGRGATGNLFVFRRNSV